MAPGELKQLNIKHFQSLLIFETEPEKRTMIGRLLDEERLKPDSAYPPADRDGPGPHPSAMRLGDAPSAGGEWAIKEVHYGIVKIEDRWKVIGRGLRFGSYHTKADAVGVVRRIAEHAAGLVPVQLHLDDEDGSLRWS